MEIEYCSIGNNAPLKMLQDLHINQGQSGRHKCAICAFNEGYNNAINNSSYLLKDLESCKDFRKNKIPIAINKKLHDYQGGTGRHKCTICAYNEGFKLGLSTKKDLLDIKEFNNIVNKKINYKIEIIDNQAVNISNNQIGFEYNGYNNTKDYIEISKQRKNLGLLGELIIVNYEKLMLENYGRKDLSEKIEHISVEYGDMLGYDILSFDKDGNCKYIEVKTTTGNINTPFFITINEYNFSEQNSDLYYLYRLFDLSKNTNKASLFVFQGSISNNFDFIPTEYKIIGLRK